ncbi:MAG TPA: amidohydrolase family protein [candidate division Zixibacteria bacterium]|nr:amidohydrolase family protein [candidate division Zixibacteria bacterium]
MAERPLVVQGGKLIDGTGRRPVENAAIVIRGGRFQAVGRTGDVPIPPDAEVIDVRGKTILPGFIDGHGHLEDFHGELYLHLGITTCASIELYQDGPWTRAQKQGTDLGKIRGPRIWMSGRAIGAPGTGHDAFGSRTLRDNIIVTTPDEVRAAVRRKKELGCDILKVNEFLSMELLKVAVEEAHRLDMPVAAHSWDAVGSSRAGVDAIEHIWSVGYSSIPYVPARRKLAEDRLGGVIDQELAGAYYQTENYGAVIAAMVEHGVAFTPTIAKWLRPLSPSAERFRARENQILSHPEADLPASVRAVTENAYDKLLKRYTPEQLAQARVGYEKANEFIRRFVEAGGLLKEGSDPPRGMAALLMHEALVMDVEAGVPPLTAIQAATLNVAKAFKKDRDYGSVEPGKVADLSIVEGDPLQDIWATQNVKMVVMDGKVIDIEFHRYKNPIPSFYSYQSLPLDLEVSPLFLVEGTGPTTLRVRSKGGMWPFHRVLLNGRPLPTSFVSKNELKAVIAPEAIPTAGTYIVTLKCEGETLPESHRAHLVVGFKP